MKNRNVNFKGIVNLRVFLLFSILVLSFMLVGNVSAVSHTLTLTSSGSQDINISASAGTAISSDAINVSTTCRYGYNFTINTSVNDNNLYLNGDASNNTEGTYFSPIDDTSALNATANKWGYYYNASTTPTNNSVFSPVPTLSNPATVKTPLDTPTSSDINDNFNIYYGVSSSPTMVKGTYKMIPDTNNSNNDGTIVYTATIAEACTKYTIQFNPTSTSTGSAITGTGTMENQLVSEGVATPISNNEFTAPSGFYFAGWNTQQDGSGALYVGGQNITDLTTIGNTITLYAQWTDCPNKTLLYDLVACRSKGKQTADEVKAPITMDNSGVYEYDSSVFGDASDNSRTKNIYYYRGILDSNLDGTVDTYGSSGDGATYPNYVKLGDVCWRIVRTTGSGGIKMIYNGLYSGGTVVNSCANSQDDAQVDKQAFAIQGNSTKTSASYWIRNVNRVGYTFNNEASLQDSTTSRNVDVVFGGNSNYSTTNTTNSNVKDVIEDIWFTNINSYSGKLESSAGFCADRVAYTEYQTAALSSIEPYSTATYLTTFGSSYRQTPSLTCPLLRNIVDLYTTGSASNGNGQLAKAAALLTKDELIFAGRGYNTYLRTGSSFWLLSPSVRATNGQASVAFMTNLGQHNNARVDSSLGIRPVVSLIPNTTISSGSGTAIDPWIINP